MNNISDSFEDLKISSEMISLLQKKGFEKPTGIQSLSIPFLLQDTRDMIGQAQTGTGKTGAFGIPLVDIIKRSNHIQLLILAPTRELALQIANEIKSFIYPSKEEIKVSAVYGGQSIERQISILKNGVDIICGTPGRIMDHINRKTIDISNIKYLVLDEADEMLNMGFAEDIKFILESTPSTRRTLLFSATMPSDIRKLAEEYMKDYKILSVKDKSLVHNNISQFYYEVNQDDKTELLYRVISMEKNFYGVVFCNTKIESNKLYNELSNKNVNCEILHGDISQSQREKIISQFKRKKINLLIATDVVARGIDVENLTHVVNYSIPNNPESYVHRIGRTGRAGKEGIAINIIGFNEYRKLSYIKKISKSQILKKEIPTVEEIIKLKKQNIRNEINLINTEAEFDEDVKSFSDEIFDESGDKNIKYALVKYLFEENINKKDYKLISNLRKNFSSENELVKIFVARGRNHNINTKYDLQEFVKTIYPNVGTLSDTAVFDNFSFAKVNKSDAQFIVKGAKNSNTGKQLITYAKDKRNRNHNKNFSSRNYSRSHSRKFNN